MKFTTNLEPFAVGYLNAEYDDIDYKVASGMLERAKKMPIVIPENYIFAGYFDKEDPCFVTYISGRGIHVDETKLQKRIEANPDAVKELTAIRDAMKKLSTNYVIQNKITEYEMDLVNNKACWGGGVNDWAGGHSNPDYMMREGTSGIRAKIAKYREINKDKSVFYDALEMCLDAIEILGERYREKALELAKSAEGERKARLERMAKALEVVPKGAPRDFFEACQSYWLVFTVDTIDSPGNFDQVMIDYYRKNDEADRRDILDNLWQMFYSVRCWNLCISGSDENWNDKTNELSYAILETAKKYKYNTPNLTMRVHRNTPEDLWKLAAETIATGIGMPAIYNDEVVCPALERFGITPEHSHKYCMNGCNQIDIYGISHMGLEDGEVSLAKAVEFTLRNGKCAITGKVLGIKTGEPWEYVSYEEFFNAYKEQVEHLANCSIRMANISQRMMAKYCPNPHRSNLIEGCIEKGLDMKNKGPIYGHAQILAEGIADAVDSLASVKHFVYDTKKYTLTEVCNALEANFEGYDEMYHDFKNYVKFGNDNEEIDAIYRAVTEHYYTYLPKHETYRGGRFGGGCSTFRRAAAFGIMHGALPNGKKKGETLFADSIAATPGCDKNGPTAVIKSVLNADQSWCLSGNVMQMKFTKSLFATDHGTDAFIALAKSYFAGGGQQLSINVLSREELLDAKKHPENHKNLIVRVGGYSDYFTRLDAGLQDNVIARTEIGL